LYFCPVNFWRKPYANSKEGGCTPIHYAVLLGNVAIMAALLDNAADIDSQTDSKHTPLLLAVVQNALEAVKLLLEREANVHCKDKEGYTALHKAAWSGNIEMITALLNA